MSRDLSPLPSPNPRPNSFWGCQVRPEGWHQSISSVSHQVTSPSYGDLHYFRIDRRPQSQQSCHSSGLWHWPCDWQNSPWLLMIRWLKMSAIQVLVLKPTIPASTAPDTLEEQWEWVVRPSGMDRIGIGMCVCLCMTYLQSYIHTYTVTSGVIFGNVLNHIWSKVQSNLRMLSKKCPRSLGVQK